MRVALGQFNALVGDLSGNVKKMCAMCAEAAEAGAELVIFPELAVCGYPPEDLLYKKHFLQDNHRAVEKLAANCPQTMMIVGFAEDYQGNSYNSAAVLQAGRISKIYRKGLLPNYDVFDERRYFQPGTKPVTIKVGKFDNIAVTICADIWNIDWLANFLKETGQLQMILNISASPFYIGKSEQRQAMVNQCAERFNCAVSYCNLVGGQDELVFDGRSMFVDSTGKLIAQAKAFGEDVLIADIKQTDGSIKVEPIKGAAGRQIDAIEEAYQALVLGTADYVGKNDFKKTMVGLSGGVDSSVVAAIAVAALGAENVVGITMPSRFNSPQTIADAEKLAKNLVIELLTIPIEPVLEQFHNSLKQVQGWDIKGIAYENLQARIRGNILMSLSNQFGSLVLTTGNKSETAVGYATLYGDTAGGFAVIKDVPKTLVYKLAEYINKLASREVIPADVLTRPPSAELRAGQKDSDSLPDYELLDKILKGYVEEDKSAQQLIDDGLPKDVVKRVIRMVDRNEYKRRLSPPGIKITPKAFGRDRRLPITNRYSSFNDTV